jgi:hypothetical protein
MPTLRSTSIRNYKKYEGYSKYNKGSCDDNCGGMYELLKIFVLVIIIIFFKLKYEAFKHFTL